MLSLAQAIAIVIKDQHAGMEADEIQSMTESAIVDYVRDILTVDMLWDDGETYAAYTIVLDADDATLEEFFTN